MDLNGSINEFRETCKGGLVKVESLNAAFKALAPAFLYGGYIKVRNDYRIYIDTIEFYFHSEKKEGVKDTIVYHRNGRYGIEDVPYFEPLMFHAHASGFDIAFESQEDQYRASALIRRYTIMNADGTEYIRRDGEPIIRDDRSTYLYDILNGFGLGEANAITWVSEPKECKEDIKGEKRRNVYDLVYDEASKKWTRGERNNRPWSFTKPKED